MKRVLRPKIWSRSLILNKNETLTCGGWCNGGYQQQFKSAKVIHISFEGFAVVNRTSVPDHSYQ